MVEKAITRILELKSRHVVLPTVGTFVRRENGDMIFTDLLRADDGILVSETAAMYGLPREQARMEVAAYAASVADTLAREGRVEIEGLGTIRRGSDGAIHFMSRHTPEPETVTAPSATETAPATAPEQEPAQCCEQAPNMTVPEEAAPCTQTDEETAAPCTEDPAVAEAAPCEEETAVEAEAACTEQPASEETCSCAAQPAVEDAHHAAEHTADEAASPTSEHITAEHTAAEERPSEEDEPERPLRPHSDRSNNSRLRGALYGDRDDDNLGHTTPAATPYTAPRTDFRTAPTTPSEEPYKPQINIRHPQRPKKRLDAVMIIAILALAITLGILIYGYITKRDLNALHEQELVIDPSAQPVDVQPVEAE